MDTFSSSPSRESSQSACSLSASGSFSSKADQNTVAVCEKKMTSRPHVPQQHGVLVLHKPSGPTSARCIAAIKRLGQKKIGHAGTLDPMASGVLLVLLGHATKISGHLLADGGKTYNGVLRLGQITDTWDAEGALLEERDWQHIQEQDVRAVVQDWLGVSVQPVPPYSAAKHEGKPLYKLAREGKAVPEKTKNIEISQAEILSCEFPFVRFRVMCSSGTYIRSLAHSLGNRLGCGAVLTELTREYSHPFALEKAHTLEAILAEPESLATRILPVTAALPQWPVIPVTLAQEALLRNGRSLPAGKDVSAAKAILVSAQGEPLALVGHVLQDGAYVWSILRGLWS